MNDVLYVFLSIKKLLSYKAKKWLNCPCEFFLPLVENSHGHNKTLYLLCPPRSGVRRRRFVLSGISLNGACAAEDDGIWCATANAVPTAEGAIELAIAETPITIHNSKCLVMGYGKVAPVTAGLIIKDTIKAALGDQQFQPVLAV